MAMSYCKDYYSYKLKAMGVCYEVALNIITGASCWWHGQFEPGIYNDLMIFQRGLQGELEADSERVEADQGYQGAFPLYVQCPPFEIPDRTGMTARVRLRHETCNRRFKRWNILKAAYRHDILDHQAVFAAVVCLT